MSLRHCTLHCAHENASAALQDSLLFSGAMSFKSPELYPIINDLVTCAAATV